MSTQSAADTAAMLTRAGADLLAKADETDYSDLHSLYLDIGRILSMAGEAVAAHATEISVLVIERDSAIERAAAAEQNARSWFERHEDLVKQLMVVKAA